MANLKNDLSDRLKNFKSSYENATPLNNAATFSANLQTISSSLENSISDFKKSGSDSVINSLVANTTLAKDGLDRVKSHFDTDLSGLSDALEDLYVNVVANIEDNKSALASAQNSLNIEKQKTNADQKTINRLSYDINCLELKIEDLNSKGEAQLDSIKAAIDGVNFGVTGNMHAGGTLGANISFSDNYKFEWDDYVAAAAPIEDDSNDTNGTQQSGDLNFIQEVGCATVGFVESVVKVGEGIVDAILTPFAGIVSLFKGDDDHFLKKAIEYDFAGETVGAIGGAIAGSKEAYNDSTGKKVGSFAGSVVAHGALWVSGFGILSAGSVAGNRAEEVIQDGGTVGEGLWRGALAGGLSYTAGKFLPKVASGISNKISTYAATHTNVLARGITSLSKTIKAASTGFKNWGSLSTSGKVVSLVATPARVAAGALNKSINTGARVLTNTLGKTGAGQALINADAKVDELLSTARVRLTKTGRQQIDDYENARKAWENSGKQVNSAEYDNMVKANEKIPQSQRPVIGEKAYTTAEIDNLKVNYNKARNEWDLAGRPTSGAKYDAYNNAYQKIPQAQRPAALGDFAYTSSATNYYADDYNNATEAWIRNGSPTSGTEYNNMQTAYNNLPPETKTTTTLGRFAASEGYSDFTINNYNNKLTDWRIAGSPTSGAEYDAMKQAFDSIPESVMKPAAMGEVGMNSQTLRTLQRKYNNELTTWISNGSPQYGAEYQNMTNAWNSLPDSVRPTNAGDWFGTGIAPSTTGEKLGGGIVTGILNN